MGASPVSGPAVPTGWGIHWRIDSQSVTDPPVNRAIER